MNRQIRFHGTDDGDIVGTCRDMREKIADRNARIAVSPKLPGTLEPLATAVRGRVAGIEKRLAVAPIEFGFRIETVDVRDSAVHEAKDDVLGARLEMRRWR